MEHSNDGSSGELFDEDAIEALKELGEALKAVHDRLISEGYQIVDGKSVPPDSK